MTRPLARKRRTIPTFTEKRWLLSGRPFALPFLQNGEWAHRLWKEFGAAITARHIAKHPGSRPWGWWRYDAPERRDTSTETQLQFLRRLNLLTAEERERVAHVRPRLTRPPVQDFSEIGKSPALHTSAPAGWQFVLIDDPLELVRAGSRCRRTRAPMHLRHAPCPRQTEPLVAAHGA